MPLNHDTRAVPPTIMAMNTGPSIEADFLVIPLSEPISTDILPAGNVRGFVRVATDIPRAGTARLIGFTDHFLDGYTPGYEACDDLNAAPRFHHPCATNVGTSSSPLLLFDGQDMILAGLHSGSQPGQSNTCLPVPDSITMGNIAVRMDTIRTWLDRIGRPAIAAPAASVVPPATPAQPVPKETDL